MPEWALSINTSFFWRGGGGYQNKCYIGSYICAWNLFFSLNLPSMISCLAVCISFLISLSISCFIASKSPSPPLTPIVGFYIFPVSYLHAQLKLSVLGSSRAESLISLRNHQSTFLIVHLNII